MFHQLEGLVVDKSSHLGHLKWILQEFCAAFFEVDHVKMRFRPSYFPFTEPSLEVDIQCKRDKGEIRFGEGEDWLEILGCGMVHPNVLRNCGLDPDEYQGFAWGMGIDRIAMLKYGMPDLRAFFEADVRWLSHYGFRPLDFPSLAGGLERARPHLASPSPGLPRLSMLTCPKLRCRIDARVGPGHDGPLCGDGTGLLPSMKFTLAWLKEHLDTDGTLDDDRRQAHHDRAGGGARRRQGKLLAPFSIARVISAEQHPNADRLRVCMVDTGSGDPVQVVCGAPNARTGMKGVFVPPGAFIPGKNMTLAIGNIRGVESRGMLVSEFELQISDDHEGIIELPDDAPVGANYAQWAGLDDPMIEINLTPNRADCTGVNGIARDLAAAGMGTSRTRASSRWAGFLVPRRSRSISEPRLRSVPLSRCGSCAESRTAPRPTGCSGGSLRSGFVRSMPSSTSPISSPTTAAVRCMFSMPRRCVGTSSCGARARARSLLALDGKSYALDEIDLRHRRRGRR